MQTNEVWFVIVLVEFPIYVGRFESKRNTVHASTGIHNG